MKTTVNISDNHYTENCRPLKIGNFLRFAERAGKQSGYTARNRKNK